MARILVVAKTRMKGGVCVGAIDLEHHRSLRLLPVGRLNQPDDTPMEVGQVWEADYKILGSPFPHSEDAEATLVEFIKTERITLSMIEHLPLAIGSSDKLFNGQLDWTASRKGFLDPNKASSSQVDFSTQFWIPGSFLKRYETFEPGGFRMWEPDTKHTIKWVGVADPPAYIQKGQMTRASLSRAFISAGMDHAVHWLQISGVY